jgi:ribosome recycling factor
VAVNAIGDINNEWHLTQLDRDGIEDKLKQLSRKIEETRDQHTETVDKEIKSKSNLKN